MPFEFQYSLDIYWAVGRLWFDTPEEFRRYAQSVVRYESTTAPVPTSRRGVIFATAHDFDDATQLFMRQVAQPLRSARAARRPPYGRGRNLSSTPAWATRPPNHHWPRSCAAASAARPHCW